MATDDFFESAELMEIGKAVEACNAVAVPNPVREALVHDLGPVAARLGEYARMAQVLKVATEYDANTAALVCDKIAADIKTVKDHEVLSRITDGLHRLHRQWTGLRDLFIGPLERDRRTIKQKVIVWQEGERIKAAEAQRKLQAEADAKAAREREALLKKAAALKTPEKAEALREQAAAVIAPTVAVQAPKTGMRVSKAWKVKNIDADAFYRALVTRPDLRGYCEIKTTNMEQSKAANPSMDVPGIVFEQITR